MTALRHTGTSTKLGDQRTLARRDVSATPLDYSQRILIVDDSISIGSLWKRALTSDGYVVHCTTRGRSALTELHCREFQAVILDLGLPDMDGLDLIREIRTEFHGIKIIVISGAVGDHMDLVVSSAGADAAHAKPVSLNQLRNLICQLMDQSQSLTSFSAGL